jgi:hypothetical protein
MKPSMSGSGRLGSDLLDETFAGHLDEVELIHSQRREWPTAPSGRAGRVHESFSQPGLPSSERSRGPTPAPGLSSAYDFSRWESHC